MPEEEDGKGGGGKADLKRLVKAVNGDKVLKVRGLHMSLLA